jgi:hydroxyethylthiazole kinase-like uncharacterized protein yjeF
MERAGVAVAQFAMAIAPHARRIWIVCGPGNNGGDGYEAGYLLARYGKCVHITELSLGQKLPEDAAQSRDKAVAIGVACSQEFPQNYDLCIDALFGIGWKADPPETAVHVIREINRKLAPIISVDIPTGLNANTGTVGSNTVFADFTLAMLTLKPGMITGNGRDVCGEIWLNRLDVETSTTSKVCAQMVGDARPTKRSHNSHKGLFGDVAIIGGATGMEGAAVLASLGALSAGAGRVYVGLLGTQTGQLLLNKPELMMRDIDSLKLESSTVIAGCGGGSGIEPHLQKILQESFHLVLDADALNCIANNESLKYHLRKRTAGSTVLTPHPLEAARLLGTTASNIQNDRLSSAQTLADDLKCIVILKGSGTIIAAPGTTPWINPTGNGRLATAGAGDVLAGFIGAKLAAGASALDAACNAVNIHGRIAECWPEDQPFTASDLLQYLPRSSH